MQEPDVTRGRRDLAEGDFASLLPDLRAVIFDLAGTLCDSIGVIISCTRLTFRNLGLPLPDESKIMRQIGRKLPEVLFSLLPSEHKHLACRALDTYLELHHTHEEFKIDRLFPQAEELLEALQRRGLLLGVASGRMREGIEHTLKRTCLGRYCQAYCAGDEARSKPHPQMMQLVCERLGVDPRQCLGVGDSGLDLEMYQRSGAFSLGVQSGVYSGEALRALKPSLLLPKVTDLLACL